MTCPMCGGRMYEQHDDNWSWMVCDCGYQESPVRIGKGLID